MSNYSHAQVNNNVSQSYTIALILSDGMINDVEETIDEIV